MEINVYLLYSSIIFIAFFLAYMANGNIQVINNTIFKQKFRSPFFLMSFLVLCLFYIFTDTGVDYYNYIYKIDNRRAIEDVFYYRDIEPLFTIWAHYGWELFKNSHIVLASMKLVTMLMYFISFYILRRKIDVSLAVLVFACVAYFPSFSLIRIVLASSFLSLGCALYLNKAKLIWIFLLFTIAICLHFSSIMLIVGFITYLLFFKNIKNRKYGKALMFLLGIVILFSVTQISLLLTSFAESSESFEHYQKYVDAMRDSSIGSLAVHLVSYVVIGGTLYLVRFKIDDSHFFMMLVLVVYSFAFELLGTQVPVLERAVYDYMPVYCLILPYCIQLYSTVNMKNYSTLKIVFVLFCVFRLYFMYKSRVMPDSDSQLYYYHFFNPFMS